MQGTTSNETWVSVKRLSLALCLILFGYQSRVKAADWPQWRGPNRDGICRETGLLKSWPEGGPKIVFEISGLGKGYSSVAVVDGTIYTSGVLGDALTIFALAASLAYQLLYEYMIGLEVARVAILVLVGPALAQAPPTAAPAASAYSASSDSPAAPAAPRSQPAAIPVRSNCAWQ